MEACGIRDNFDEFKGLNATVLGVSFDSVASHKAFIAKYNLPFVLLADTDKSVAKLYGVATMTAKWPAAYVRHQQGRQDRVRGSESEPRDACRGITHGPEQFDAVGRFLRRTPHLLEVVAGQG